MDGSRRRRHKPTPQARWLAAYRTARWGRRFLGNPVPALTTLALLVIQNHGTMAASLQKISD